MQILALFLLHSGSKLYRVSNKTFMKQSLDIDKFE